MKNSKTLDEIKSDLKFCKEYWTIIYGSYLTDYFIEGRSDLDIAVITKKHKRQENLDIWYSLLGNAPSIYDIRIFELFPLYMKIRVIENYKVLYGDPLEISEYFYHYYKLWKDMEKRVEENQFNSIKEKKKLMENRKSFQKTP